MAEHYSDSRSEEIQKIDLIEILAACLKHLSRTWLLGIILVALFGGAFTYRAIRSYVPMYRASVDLVVNPDTSNSAYINKVTVQQLSATFPYIIQSGALQKVVMEELGETSLPASIGAAVVEDTNLFQIYATGINAEKTWAVVESVINNYPVVARYIIGSTTFQVLDETGVPEQPYNVLSYKRSMMKGIIIGLGIYAFILILLSFVRRTVVSANDLKPYTQVRCLAGIPRVYIKKRIRGKNTLPVLISDDNAGSAFSESFSTLRIRTEKTGKKTFVFTSVGKGEGKTTVCSNLAVAFARKEYKVLLIDADLRNPSVAGHLNIRPDRGFVDVLRHTCELKDALIQYEGSSLYVLPGGKAVKKSTGLLGRSNLENLLKNVEKEYDFIFIDAPPCSMMQDATMVTSVAKNTIMVVRQDYSMRSRILECMDMIKETGGELTGYVINRESTGIGSYGYGKYGYGKYGYGKSGYGKYGYGKSRYGYGYGYGQKED